MFLDDFLVIGRPSSSRCEEQLKIVLERLNIPVADGGPDYNLGFPGNRNGHSGTHSSSSKAEGV